MNLPKRLMWKLILNEVGLQRRFSLYHTRSVSSSGKVSSSISRREEDWISVRDIFIKAFHHYPLYKYLASDESKRSEFLKQYLDSVYYVTTRKNKSVLAFFSKSATETTTTSNAEVIIGGSLLHRPCFDEGGWKSCRDEDFAKEYEHFNLKKIDNDAFDKLKRYESWESTEILQKIQSTGIPMWDAMFYGITPKEACNGSGKQGFDIGVPDLYKCQKQYEAEEIIPYKVSETHESNLLSGITRLCSYNNSDRSPVISKTHEKVEEAESLIPQHGNSIRNPFLILGISHCHRAARFHANNRMELITKLTYDIDKAYSKAPFEVYVMLFDPFNTGLSCDIRKSFSS
ncbi:uncharacterized protein LOC144425233 [Styela clava]